MPIATPITAPNAAWRPISRIWIGTWPSSGTLPPLTANQMSATSNGTVPPMRPNTAPTGAAARIFALTTRARRGTARNVVPAVP